LAPRGLTLGLQIDAESPRADFSMAAITWFTGMSIDQGTIDVREVVPFATDTISTAVHFYEARADKDWSLTDCLSFLVMEQRLVPRALTTDRHFQQAFETVLLGDPPETG